MMQTKAQTNKGKGYNIPARLQDAYIMKLMQWSWQDLQTCPEHILNDIRLLFSLDAIEAKENRKETKTRTNK